MSKFEVIKKTLDDVVSAQKTFRNISNNKEFKKLNKQVKLVDYSTVGANFISGFCFATNSYDVLPVFLSTMTLSGNYLHTKEFVGDTADLVPEDFQKKYKNVNKTFEYSRKGLLNVAAFYLGTFTGHYVNANK